VFGRYAGSLIHLESRHTLPERCATALVHGVSGTLCVERPPHCHTACFAACLTACFPLLRCCAAACLTACFPLLHCCAASVPVSHCCTAELLHCCTAALLRCLSACFPLLRCCAAALLRCLSACFPLLRCCTAALLRCLSASQVRGFTASAPPGGASFTALGGKSGVRARGTAQQRQQCLGSRAS